MIAVRYKSNLQGQKHISKFFQNQWSSHNLRLGTYYICFKALALFWAFSVSTKKFECLKKSKESQNDSKVLNIMTPKNKRCYSFDVTSTHSCLTSPDIIKKKHHRTSWSNAFLSYRKRAVRKALTCDKRQYFTYTFPFTAGILRVFLCLKTSDLYISN